MDKEKNIEKSDVKENNHFGHRERLRKKVFETKLKSFSEEQVLEYLLSFIIARKDTLPIAKDLLGRFGSLKNIFLASVEDLTAVKNIGNSVANFLRSLPLVFDYYNQMLECSESVDLSSPKQLYNYVKPYFAGLTQEQLLLIVVDEKGNSIMQTAYKLNDRQEVDVKQDEIFRVLRNCNGAFYVIVHNHLNGSCIPSLADSIATRKLYIASKFNNLTMNDHIIIGKDGYFSYRMSALLDSYKNDFNNFSYSNQDDVAIQSQKIQQNSAKYINKPGNENATFSKESGQSEKNQNENKALSDQEKNYLNKQAKKFATPDQLKRGFNSLTQIEEAEIQEEEN